MITHVRFLDCLHFKKMFPLCDTTQIFVTRQHLHLADAFVQCNSQ